jgi:hypothetical protein
MSRPSPLQPIPDPDAGMDRTKAMLRGLLSVPKSELDKIRAKEKAAKDKGKK